jgi:epoxide hydrolase
MPVGSVTRQLIQSASFRGLGMSDMNTPVTVPAAVTVFPRDLQRLPRLWVEERYRDLRY